MEFIYTVTTLDLEFEEDPKHFPKILEQRTPGWFIKLEDAKQCVEENWGDIRECNFTHAVIEKMREGLYAQDLSEEYWYMWNKETSKFEPIEKPECFNCIAGFSYT